MASVKWRWQCVISEARGTVNAPGNDPDLALHRAQQRHDRGPRVGACIMNAPCITQVTNAETGEVWVQDTARLGPATLGKMRKLEQHEVKVLASNCDTKQPGFDPKRRIR